MSSRSPFCDMEDEDVELSEWDYSDRAVDDFVVVRTLSTLYEARAWGTERYGARLKRITQEPDTGRDGTRWAFLIRKVTP